MLAGAAGALRFGWILALGPIRFAKHRGFAASSEQFAPALGNLVYSH
jgi:hypothetical protein